MTREIMSDISNYFDLKSRFKDSTSEFWTINVEKLKLEGTHSNPFNELGGISSLIDAEPIVFATEADFYEYVGDTEYELVDEKPGMCLAILIDDRVKD